MSAQGSDHGWEEVHGQEGSDGSGMPASEVLKDSVKPEESAVPTSSDKDSAEAVAAEKIAEGSECDVQILYEGPPKCQCCINWVEEYPEDLRMEIEQQEQTKQKALVVRMRKNHGEGKSLALDSILIQSQKLRSTLAQVFEGYEGITPSLKKLVFRAPFHPFHYRWENFTRILEEQKKSDPDAASHSQLLYDVLDAELRDRRSEIDDLVRNGVMTYSRLWSLFEPGIRVVAKVGPSVRFFITQSSGFDKKGIFVVDGKYVDWDGKQFGYAHGSLQICPFAGTRAIADLEVHPARFHPNLEEVESEIIARGRRFREFRGFHYMAYAGQMTFKNSWKKWETGKAEGRIVIDADSHFDANSTERIALEALDSPAIVPTIQIGDRQHVGEKAPPADIIGPDLKNRMIENGMMEPEKDTEPVHDLTDEQLLLCTSKLRGYCLTLKVWAAFEIANVKEITWNDAAFPNLMLPPKYKSLVLSFIEGQTSGKHQFDDLIEGKGQGVVMLLVGNPGTGKTLTAESVADRVRRPLYILSVGELGQRGRDVERSLKSILELTEKWNAVLLFDECDVLLQERSSKHLQHNEIVAVFLRMLEYYRGIIVMTTNRAETMDRAFQSRIHLTLRYPDLDTAAKEHIWRYFVTQRAVSATLTDDAYARLAQLPLNGRQIKNTVKIATLLAVQEEESLNVDYIDTVLQATMDLESTKVATKATITDATGEATD